MMMMMMIIIKNDDDDDDDDNDKNDNDDDDYHHHHHHHHHEEEEEDVSLLTYFREISIAFCTIQSILSANYMNCLIYFAKKKSEPEKILSRFQPLNLTVPCGIRIKVNLISILKQFCFCLIFDILCKLWQSPRSVHVCCHYIG